MNLKIWMGMALLLAAVNAFAAEEGAGASIQPEDHGGTPNTVVRCQSWPNQSNYCYAGGPVAYVQLRYQLSYQSCVQGYTWGYDANGVWVSNGCAADFDVYFQAYNPPPPPPTLTQDVYCSSINHGYAECGTSLRQITQAQLIRQMSGSACTLNRTWGTRYNAVWVNDGCRGVFRVWGY